MMIQPVFFLKILASNAPATLLLSTRPMVFLVGFLLSHHCSMPGVLQATMPRPIIMTGADEPVLTEYLRKTRADTELASRACWVVEIYPWMLLLPFDHFVHFYPSENTSVFVS
jgi:hypothetical protein